MERGKRKEGKEWNLGRAVWREQSVKPQGQGRANGQVSKLLTIRRPARKQTSTGAPLVPLLRSSEEPQAALRSPEERRPNGRTCVPSHAQIFEKIPPKSHSRGAQARPPRSLGFVFGFRFGVRFRFRFSFALWNTSKAAPQRPSRPLGGPSSLWRQS